MPFSKAFEASFLAVSAACEDGGIRNVGQETGVERVTFVVGYLSKPKTVLPGDFENVGCKVSEVVTVKKGRTTCGGH